MFKRVLALFRPALPVGSPRFTVTRSLSDLKYYWHLQSGNGEIVASSEGYDAKSSALDGIEACRRAAAVAPVVTP